MERKHEAPGKLTWPAGIPIRGTLVRPSNDSADATSHGTVPHNVTAGVGTERETPVNESANVPQIETSRPLNVVDNDIHERNTSGPAPNGNTEHAPLPSFSNLPLNEIRIYDPRWTRRPFPPIPSVHSLFETVRRRGIDLFANCSSRDRLLGKRRRAEIRNISLCEPEVEPPLKVYGRQPTPDPLPNSQTSEQTDQRFQRPSEKGDARPLTPDGQQIIRVPMPNSQTTGQTALQSETPYENGGAPPLRPYGQQPTHFPIPNSQSAQKIQQCETISENPRQGSCLPCPGPNGQPAAPLSASGIGQATTAGHNTTPMHPLGPYGYPDQRNVPALAPVPPSNPNPGPGNMMWVNNFWQNVYYPQPGQVPPPEYAHLQLPPLVRAPPGPLRIMPHGNVEPLQGPTGRVYDLAKIRRLGFMVINGRVYNQQNHPMCAAPRENGNPCKRNVSRSACKWHGGVSLLTRHNTKNGLLDDHGNLIHVGVPPTGNPNHTSVPQGSRQQGSEGQRGPVPVAVPIAFNPPALLSRSLRWNNEEHYWFLLGLQKYGNKWSIISKVVQTRNTLQVQSHAQKFFERQNKVEKKKSTIHDLKLDGRDMAAVAEKYTDEQRERRLNLAAESEDGQPRSRRSVSVAGPSSQRN